MVNPFEHATEEHRRIHEAITSFAQATGCEIRDEGGKQFARAIMVAVAEG